MNRISQIISFVGVVLLSSPLYAQISLPKVLFNSVDQAAMHQWVDSVYNSLSDEARLAQLIMPIIYPSAEDATIKREELRIKRYKWGGILYQKGRLRDQLIMNERLQRQSQTPMLIALDGEWGLYMRLKDAPRFPRNLGLGLNGDVALIYAYAREVARECRLMGIHVNFAPTVDVNINPNNPVIGSRSFGGNAKDVSRLSEAYAAGLEDGGILSVAKHFPGHGDTNEDSHKTLPVVGASRQRLNQVELVPFKNYISSGFGGIMTAHLNIPALEKQTVPSSLSYSICTDLLQRDLKFKGLIFTDGLEMKGVQKATTQDIGLSALLAGNDILLGPPNPEVQLYMLIQALQQGKISMETIENKVRKVLAYKYRLIISQDKPQATAENIYNLIWTANAKSLQSRLWRRSLYKLYSTTEDADLIKADLIKRIAVVDYGKMSFVPKFKATRAKNGQIIEYPSWTKFLENPQAYDLVLFNNYTSQQPPKELLSWAKSRPVILTYFSTPYRVKREPWMQCFRTVLLAMEPVDEARTAVLQSVFGLDSSVASNLQIEQSLQNKDDDPTAEMTPQR